MSTRSQIAVEYETGQIETIYCHSDGYPSGNGKLLLEHYREPSKVEALLALGNLSILGEEIGEKHPWDAKWNYSNTKTRVFKYPGTNPPWKEKVYWQFPPEQMAKIQTWCVSYSRDRSDDEAENRAIAYKNVAEFLKDIRSGYLEAAWVYLWRDGRWWCNTGEDDKWHTISEAAYVDVNTYREEAQEEYRIIAAEIATIETALYPEAVNAA